MIQASLKSKTNFQNFMDTFDAIEQRRSVKNFDPNHTMSKQEIDKILSAAILSPTSYNIQHWRFVAITDKQIKEKMRAASHDQAHVSDASVVLVLCADLLSWKKDPARYWKNAPKTAQDYLAPAIMNSYEGKERLQRDEAIRSTSMAAQTIMLAAKAMNYDSCPMIGFDPLEVAKIIGLPSDHIIVMMIVIGKALKPANPRGGQLSLDEVRFENHF